jgi:hypothetical protein
MSRKADPVRIRQWWDRLDRYEQSQQTVAGFCLDEGVSQWSFYYWKRKLAETAKESRSKPAGKRQLARDASTDSLAFQPVLVAPANYSAGVTVRIGDGVVVDLGHDRLMVESVIKQVLDHQSAREA